MKASYFNTQARSPLKGDARALCFSPYGPMERLSSKLPVVFYAKIKNRTEFQTRNSWMMYLIVVVSQCLCISQVFVGSFVNYNFNVNEGSDVIINDLITRSFACVRVCFSS